VSSDADWLPFRPFRTAKGIARGAYGEVVWVQRDEAIALPDPTAPVAAKPIVTARIVPWLGFRGTSRAHGQATPARAMRRTRPGRARLPWAVDV
jgi:hypothetical protein